MLRKSAMPEIQGLHHVTAICGPAQENYDFYAGVLGLRLVKLTINYDDRTAYHLYFGDGMGTPGTILTFFPYPEARPGRPGRGHVNATSLAIPREAAAFWVDRLRHFEVEMDKPQSRDGHQVIGFRAPDGLCLELVGLSDFQPTKPWEADDIPANKAIGAVRSITISVDELAPTQELLTEVMGAVKIAEKDVRHCFALGSCFLEVIVNASGPRGRGGHGSIHHVAFRVESEADQLAMRELLLARDIPVSSVMDRTYFKSIYFKEPGGSLFEIATAGPGFMVDESFEDLGTSLQLPPQFAAKRLQIQRGLKPLEL